MRMPLLILAALTAAVQPVAAQDAVALDAARTPVVAVQVEDDASATLEDLLWIARPVVVFADTENDPRFRQQMTMLQENPEDLVERDVLILTDTDPAALGPLRLELRPRGFGLVLIDKDGSVVQRRPTPTTVRELTHTIDRLPSRRQETGSLRQ